MYYDWQTHRRFVEVGNGALVPLGERIVTAVVHATVIDCKTVRLQDGRLATCSATGIWYPEAKAPGA